MKPRLPVNNPINYAIFSYLTGFIFLISILFFEYYFRLRNDPDRITKIIEETLKQKEIYGITKVKEIIYSNNAYDILREKNHDKIKFPEISKDGLTFQFYLNDSLVFSPDNSLAELNKSELGDRHSVMKLNNGWYDIITTQKDSLKVTILILLKYNYSFENEFLSNSFQNDFNAPDEIGISKAFSDRIVRSFSGQKLFSLVFKDFQASYDSYTFILLLFLLFGFISFSLAFYFSYTSFHWLRNKPWLFVFCFTVDVLILRLLQIAVKFPSQLYSTELFSPLLYSSSFFLPSAGDYLVNSILLLVISFVIYKKLSSEIANRTCIYSCRQVYLLIPFIFILLAFVLITLAFDDIVKNSSFSLDLKNISTVSWNSLIGFIIVFILSLSFFLLTKLAGAFARSIKGNKQTMVLLTALIAVIYFFIGREIWDLQIVVCTTCLLIAYLFLMLFWTQEQVNPWPFSNLLLPLIWVSVLAALMFNNANFYREREERKLIAVKLATGKNPVTEMMYGQLEHKLLNDSVIREMIKSTNTKTEEEIIKRIKTNYIKGYWNRFVVQITVCSPGKLLKIQPKGYLDDCAQYFKRVNEKFGEKTAHPNLFYLDYGTGNENYLAVFNPDDNDTSKVSQPTKIFIELTAKIPVKDLGYPELLMDKRIMNFPEIGSYSYALYQYGSLVYRTGKYPYKQMLVQVLQPSAGKLFFDSDGMNHYKYRMDKSRLLIISRSNDNILATISPVSYLFIMFSFLTLILNLLVRPGVVRRFSLLTLKNRFQIANVGIIVLSFLLMGCLLVYFLIRLNNLKNTDSFTERTLSVMSEMQDKYSEQDKFDRFDRSGLEEELIRLSNIFYTDLNVYSPEGKIIISSKPQIFDEGLISGRMNSRALNELTKGMQTLYFQDEKIGSYSYRSAYFSLFNDKNDLLAYINLPFFARQEDLKREVSDFLVAFMNLYVLFILLSVFISYVISRYLSAPLSMLVSRMKAVQLGKQNAKINWKKQDEIGRLVNEYNRMIDELEKSAEQLARSERESAWREMARQVAHEIKNPLTPMKLSVQHLQKAWDEKSGDFTTRIQKFSKVMSNQIDSLAHIASEFSDFAKMPAAVKENIDLIDLISSVASMYYGLPNIKLELDSSLSSAKISGDQKQLIRAFTNLLNNAIQAIGDKENGKILISVNKEIKNFVIHIEDNGRGISEEVAGKIFLPNFTTRSGGTGLGLAIVQEIIHGMNGEVKFSSSEKGTVFTIMLPGAFNPENDISTK